MSLAVSRVTRVALSVFAALVSSVVAQAQGPQDAVRLCMGPGNSAVKSVTPPNSCPQGSIAIDVPTVTALAALASSQQAALTALQAENASQQAAIAALQAENASQQAAIGAVQTVNMSQQSAITALQANGASDLYAKENVNPPDMHSLGVDIEMVSIDVPAGSYLIVARVGVQNLNTVNDGNDTSCRLAESPGVALDNSGPEAFEVLPPFAWRFFPLQTSITYSFPHTISLTCSSTNARAIHARIAAIKVAAVH
jgi:hypothetical protein